MVDYTQKLRENIEYKPLYTIVCVQIFKSSCVSPC